jgi:hypothetical protein
MISDGSQSLNILQEESEGRKASKSRKGPNSWRAAASSEEESVQ